MSKTMRTVPIVFCASRYRNRLEDNVDGFIVLWDATVNEPDALIRVIVLLLN